MSVGDGLRTIGAKLRLDAVLLSASVRFSEVLDLERALDYARQTAGQIRACLADPEENRGEEDGFPARGTAGKCRICEYRILCPERQDGQSGPP